VRLKIRAGFAGLKNYLQNFEAGFTGWNIIYRILWLVEAGITELIKE